jgi:hypothetical protein
VSDRARGVNAMWFGKGHAAGRYFRVTIHFFAAIG